MEENEKQMTAEEKAKKLKELMKQNEQVKAFPLKDKVEDSNEQNILAFNFPIFEIYFVSYHHQHYYLTYTKFTPYFLKISILSKLLYRVGLKLKRSNK